MTFQGLSLIKLEACFSAVKKMDVTTYTPVWSRDSNSPQLCDFSDYKESWCYIWRNYQDCPFSPMQSDHQPDVLDLDLRPQGDSPLVTLSPFGACSPCLLFSLCVFVCFLLSVFCLLYVCVVCPLSRDGEEAVWLRSLSLLKGFFWRVFPYLNWGPKDRNVSYMSRL